MEECLLCCSAQSLFILGECGHRTVCLVCGFKLRALSKKTKCVSCARESAEVVVVGAEAQGFAELKKLPGKTFSGGLRACSATALEACEQLQLAPCPLGNCPQKQPMRSDQLQRHLAAAHQRSLCGLCVESRSLLLAEQRSFTRDELRQHCEHGDAESGGVAPHPFCRFCRLHLFNEASFLVHMREAHHKCEACPGAAERFTFYSTVEDYRRHAERFHFTCTHEACPLGFIAFATEARLQSHLVATHGHTRRGPLNIFPELETPAERERDVTGWDVREALPSQRKQPEREETINEIDFFDLIEHVVNDMTLSDEQLLIAHRTARTAAQQGEYVCKQQIYLEDVSFVKPTDDAPFTSAQFEAGLKSLFGDFEAEVLLRLCRQLGSASDAPSRLLDRFVTEMGIRLGLKQFFLFSKTQSPRAMKGCLVAAQMKTRTMSFKNQGCLASNKLWTELLCGLRKIVGTHLTEQFYAERTIKSSNFVLGSYSQLLGCAIRLSLRQFSRFQFLGNFLTNSESRKNLQHVLFASPAEVSGLLRLIPLVDLLVIHLYLFFAEKSSRKVQYSSKADNILYWFLRDRPALAAKLGVKLPPEKYFFDEEKSVAPQKKEAPTPEIFPSLGETLQPSPNQAKVPTLTPSQPKTNQTFTEETAFPELTSTAGQPILHVAFRAGAKKIGKTVSKPQPFPQKPSSTLKLAVASSSLKEKSSAKETFPSLFNSQKPPSPQHEQSSSKWKSPPQSAKTKKEPSPQLAKEKPVAKAPPVGDHFPSLETASCSVPSLLDDMSRMRTKPSLCDKFGYASLPPPSSQSTFVGSCAMISKKPRKK